MMGSMIPQQQQRAMGLTSGSTQGLVSASHVNSFRVAAVAERLLTHVRPGNRSDPGEFFTLCLSLARGIDYAIANNDIPARAQELPSLLKQVYHRKNEYHLQAAVMVLMISVKNACKNGWFLVQDADELLTLANEIGRSFCTPADINIEPSSLPHVISKVMSRFFPRMKIGHVLASLEVKPGFGAFAVDFHILKNKVVSPQEKIRLFVVQTDNILTSSCIITPQQVNFLLNGKGVDRRINVSMDTGPQLPTNVTAMLKYGTNLLQAIGQFIGNYVIAIAFMSMETSSDVPVLQDYVQPFVALESDSEIIEGPSRISLNCPISFRRIKTPVKGQFCKHHQCFDYENYIEINSRRPSWRCPHCNQSVCYMDLCIDQNMVKVLKEVRGNVADVIISSDGSWKPVKETDDQRDEHRERTPRYGQDGSEQFESTRSSDSLANVVDLTVEGAEENDAMDTCETEDRKPLKDTLPGYSITGVPVASEITQISNTSEVTQNLFPQVEDDFWSGIFFPSPSNGTVAPSISESPPANAMLTPVLTDAVSPALNREFMDMHGTTQAAAIIPHFAANNLQLQPSQVGNSIINSEYGRSSIPRQVSRTPIAIQALPAQPQVATSHNQARTGLNSLMPNGAHPITSQISPTMAPITDALNVVNGETERQQQFSRSLINPPSDADVSSSSMLHYSAMTQNWDQGRPYISIPFQQQVVGLPVTSQVQGSYRVSSALPSERQSPHHQTPPNIGMHQITSPPAMGQPSSHFLPMQVQQGGAQGVISPRGGSATNSRNRRMAAAHKAAQVARSPPAVPVQLQAPRSGSSFPSIGEQRGTSSGPVSRADGLIELPLEQNWRPTGRMRGSLSGRAYSAALSQLLIQPTQSIQAATPTPDHATPPSVSPQLQVLIANNINSQARQQVYPRTGDSAGRPGGSSIEMH